MLAAYNAGCRRFDSALTGLGGCPFAGDELVGNIATETVVRTLAERGVETGLTLAALTPALVEAARDSRQVFSPRVMAMSYSTLTLGTRWRDVALLTLNRPEKRNALSPQLIEELLAALDAVEAAGAIRVLILTGAGQAFCSGMDLEYLKGLAGQSRGAESGRRTAHRAHVPPPVELSQADHRRRQRRRPWPADAASPRWAISRWHRKMRSSATRRSASGFMPALISAFLQMQVGEKVARDLLLSGRVFDAAEAQALGLVTKVVPAAQLLPAARETGRSPHRQQSRRAAGHQAPPGALQPG